MKIYRYDIPIKDPILNDEALYMELYINALSCPSKDSVVQAIDNMHERESSLSHYNNEWLEAKEVVLNTDVFPTLSEDVIHGDYKHETVPTNVGLRPMSVMLIIPEGFNMFSSDNPYTLDNPGC